MGTKGDLFLRGNARIAHPVDLGAKASGVIRTRRGIDVPRTNLCRATENGAWFSTIEHDWNVRGNQALLFCFGHAVY